MRLPTKKQNEEGAKLCESWGEKFPVLFPEQNMTRKMINIRDQFKLEKKLKHVPFFVAPHFGNTFF